MDLGYLSWTFWLPNGREFWLPIKKEIEQGFMNFGGDLVG